MSNTPGRCPEFSNPLSAADTVTIVEVCASGAGEAIGMLDKGGEHHLQDSLWITLGIGLSAIVRSWHEAAVQHTVRQVRFVDLSSHAIANTARQSRAMNGPLYSHDDLIAPDPLCTKIDSFGVAARDTARSNASSAS